MAQGIVTLTEQDVRRLNATEIEDLLLQGGYNWARILDEVQSEEGRIKLANIVRPLLYFGRLEKLPNDDLVPTSMGRSQEASA